MTDKAKGPARPPKGYVDGYGADRDSFKLTPLVVKAKRSRPASGARPASQPLALGK